MSAQIHDITLFDNMRAIARSAGSSMLARRIRTTTAAVSREIWELMNAAANMRDDLRRMADECEGSDPEQAARLRKLANSHWSH